MKNRFKIVISVVIICFIGLKAYSYYYPKTSITIISSNTNDSKNFSVLWANTLLRKYQGLSNRKDLGKYDGMLFTFNTPAKYSFVMRDMEFPLDIIWIDDNVIVDIDQNLLPEPNITETNLTKYTPSSSVDTVLEVKAGFVKQNNIRIGDYIIKENGSKLVN